MRLLNFLWRQLEYETSAQIGEGLTCVVRGGHFWQFGSIGSIASLAIKTTILVFFFGPKHGL